MTRRRAPKPPSRHPQVAMLSEVEAMMRKKQYHEVMIDNQMLSTLARWLRPMPDGSLVSLQVRTALLAGLQRFEIDETILGSLRSSGIGKYVKLLTLHRLEQPANKKVAVSLIEKWSRPIFRTAAKFEATEMPIAARAIQLDKVAARKDEAAELGSSPSTPGQSLRAARVCPARWGWTSTCSPRRRPRRCPPKSMPRRAPRGGCRIASSTRRRRRSRRRSRSRSRARHVSGLRGRADPRGAGARGKDKGRAASRSFSRPRLAQLDTCRRMVLLDGLHADSHMCGCADDGCGLQGSGRLATMRKACTNGSVMRTRHPTSGVPQVVS